MKLECGYAKRGRSRDCLSAPPFFMFVVGGVLLSHILPGAVPSALVGLASGFGMGPGVSQPLSPPTRLILGVLFSFIFSSSASADGVVCLILHSGPRVIRCSRLVLLAGYSVF